MSDTLQRGAVRLAQHMPVMSPPDTDLLEVAWADYLAADPGIRALVERLEYYRRLWGDKEWDGCLSYRDKQDDLQALRKWEHGND